MEQFLGWNLLLLIEVGVLLAFHMLHVCVEYRCLWNSRLNSGSFQTTLLGELFFWFSRFLNDVFNSGKNEESHWKGKNKFRKLFMLNFAIIDDLTLLALKIWELTTKLNFIGIYYPLLFLSTVTRKLYYEIEGSRKSWQLIISSWL